MALDKWIAVVVLLVSLIYGYAAYYYPLLPFERNMSFLPNTMPMVISAIGVLLSLIIILAPKSANDDSEAAEIDITRLREYKSGQAVALIVAMILYALALRPIGFLTATVAFLVGTGWILGERKLVLMVPVAMIGAGVIWYLVQEVLGIFLRPYPWFV